MDNELTALESATPGTRLSLERLLQLVPFNADGLIPAIAQDAESKEVLMLAWMNEAAIRRTLDEGYACYYSRSRQTFWRKGETSGNLQRVQSVFFDCDADTLLLQVEQTGPACHTNRMNCFYLAVDGDTVRVDTSPV